MASSTVLVLSLSCLERLLRGEPLSVPDPRSKGAEVVRTLSLLAETTMARLRSTQASHGLPEVVVYENDLAFTSPWYKMSLAFNRAKSAIVWPCHPASNNTTEGVVQKMKAKTTRPGELGRHTDQSIACRQDVTGRAVHGRAH